MPRIETETRGLDNWNRVSRYIVVGATLREYLLLRIPIPVLLKIALAGALPAAPAMLANET